jgi:hypothetical protein
MNKVWGDWKFNAANPPSLDFHGGYYRGNPYQVLVRDVNTWLGFCQKLRHLEQKSGPQSPFTNQALGDFVRAVMAVCELGYPKEKAA